jgi:uncharacterized membrane protein YfcA
LWLLKEANYLLFFLAALLAEILGTIGGFGSSVFFVPIANFFLDYQSVLGITAIFHVFSNISKIVLFRKHFHLQTIIWLGLPSVVLVIIGAWFSAVWDSRILQLLLGIFLCIFSVFFLWNPENKIAVNKTNMVTFGAIAGFLAGLLGTGGAIRGLMLSSMAFSKEVFVGTSAIIDFGVDVSRAVVYSSNGFVHQHDWVYILILFFVAILGSYLGKIVLSKMKAEQFQKVVLIFVFISGVSMIIKFLNA